MHRIAIFDNGQGLEVEFPNGTIGRYHALWLRENSQSLDAVDPRNGQKRLRIQDIPSGARIRAVEHEGSTGILVHYLDDTQTAHLSFEWLARHTGDWREEASHPLLPASVTTFDSHFEVDEATFSWPEVQSAPDRQIGWLRCIRRFGFARLRNVSPEPGALERVVEAFGYIRETNYGRLFEVRSEPTPINLAYTNAGLQVHTDNPYREPIPTLQLLHCLENEAEGGESLVVDGFRAAIELQETHPEGFRLLSRTLVPFRFESSDVRLEARRPMIQLDAENRLFGVCFNNRSLAAVTLPYERIKAFYTAYRRFSSILEHPDNSVSFRLDPGEVFIVDNRRVLHGRKQFSACKRRHLQGCYADVDSLISRLAVLERKVGSRGQQVGEERRFSPPG